MADNILFKSGLASKLNDITKIAGQLLFAIDGTSGSIYLDKDTNTRIKMNLDATKLQNARKINGTAFDGTQDITTTSWGSKRTVTISDNDGTNTQANANVDGSANFTLKLPATIKATLTGKASTAGHADTAGSATTAASCTGNAATATKLQTARNINGTSFDGSASITTANWGTARDITIGSTKKSVNGSQNYLWTLNDIGALPGKTTSGTVSAAGWYRIATSSLNIINNLGQFTIQANPSGKHCLAIINAGISYGYTSGINLQQISYVSYSSGALTKARIVYNSTYSNNYAYLEVYTAVATNIYAQFNGYGWTLVSPTAGSIPSGYTSKEITFVSDSIVSNLSGKATSAGTADSAAKWTTPRKITLSGKVTGSVDIDGSQNVTVTTSLANNYAGSSTDGGAANSALKLTTSAGDSNTPVYFKDGVPVAVTSIDVKADKAGLLDPGKKINGTLFTGAADITTANWGTSRTISISDTAGTTGTSVNGSTNYSLIVPSTMTGFNSITSNKLISTTISSDTGHIVFPDGGQYITSSSTKTGYLKITLPVSWTNAMMRFYVDIYNYSSNSSFTYIIGGYNYASNSSWQNTYAQSIGAPGKGLGNLTVRFGHDGTKCAIYIGESNTGWSYPQIIIRDIFIGFQQDEKNYTTGWNIDFTTTLGTITSTISNPNVAYKLYTPRTINGKEFDGSANITTTTWGTARDLTIGNSTKSVNGSAAVTWTLSDIGAVAKAGDTMTGILTGKTTSTSWIYATRNGAFRTSTAASNNSAASVISMKTINGSWGIANLYGDDNLYFVFGTDTDYNTGVNNFNHYSISTAGHFSGSAEKANKWSNARSFAISNKAGAGTAISVDGSQSAYTLTIPSTITDFVSIGTKDLTASGTITAKSFSGSLTGNADTATKWKSPITVKIGNTSKTIQGGETATIEYNHNEIGATISNLEWISDDTSGPILKLSVNKSENKSATIPSASTSTSGVVTIGDQSFSGNKTFNGKITANNNNGASLVINTSLQDHSSPVTQALVINSSGTTDTITEITDKNAPGIGFHISAANWGSLIFNNEGFKFINNSATGYKPVYASNFYGNLVGNANTATEFNSSRAIALTGNVTGSATSTGKSGWSIATTIANGAVTNGMLKNSSISIAGNSVSLGGSLAASTLVSSLGLSNAMHFIGIARNAITDGSTTNPNVENWDFATVKPGDVVIDKDNSYEYVWSTAGKWERLGPDGSYKVVQNAVDTNSNFKVGSNTATYISNILQNSNGNIEVYKSTINNLAIKLNGGTTEDTDLFTYNGSATKTINITPDAIGATVIPFIIGTQTSATGTWTGTTTEISTLEDGQTIRYWLPYNGSGNATLNLTLKDGSKTGDIPCYRSGTSRLTTHFAAGNVIVFTYRKNVSIAGSSTTYSGWWVNADYDSDTRSMLRYDNARVIAGTNGIYGYSLIALDNNNRWQGFVKSSSTGTTKSMNTEAKFRLPINILYYGTSNNATNGNYVPNTYQIYSAYPSVDLRYSHNYTTNFAINTPVYLEGTIDSDGYFSISTTCITQTFTSGKYYILLGTSNNGNAFQLALHTTHPIYYYDGTKLIDYAKKLYANNLTINGKTYNGTSDVDVGTLGVEYGGTGITTNPSMLVNLGSGTAANILVASPRPGVTGTLGIGNGGTGKTNATDACNSFINALSLGSSTPVDSDYYISQYVGGGTAYTTYHRRPMSALYAYIKGKAEGNWNINSIGLKSIGRLDSQEKIDNFLVENIVKYATFKTSEDNNIGMASNDGMILSIPWEGNTYGAQIAFDDVLGGLVKVRGKFHSWGNWYTLLHSGNYTNYTVTKTGSGASGNWDINVTGSSRKLSYTSQLTTDDLINDFNTVNTFQVSTWNGTSSPGVSNGIIISTGWNSTSFGAQIAIDDDPTYYIALRQRSGEGWKAWKRIPMGDGTGASGTWGINITGNSATSNTANKLAQSVAVSLTGDVKGSATSDGSSGWSITTAYNTIVPTGKGGTGNADGRAPKAEKLVNSSNTDLAVGSASKPVYFSGGIPVECTSIGLNSSSASKWANKMTLKLSGTATTTNPSTVSFDGSEGSNGVSLSMPSQISGLTNLSTTKLVLASTAVEAHITFGREGWNYIKAPVGGSIAFVPNNRAISGAGAVLAISDGEIIPGYNDNTINLGNSSYKWKNVYATTFNGNATTATSLSGNVIIKISGTAGNNNSVTFKTAGEYTHSLPQTITNFTKVESDTFVVNDKVTLQYNSTNECLEFVFA